MYILLANASAVPDAFGVILSEAFATESAFGGLIGALIQGFRRAAFSNEAGVGSASIAHSAAATDEPVREGVVALLEPFIDTIVVCTMTGLVVVITGAYLDTGLSGVEMTSAAFGSVISWFPMILSIAVFFFAFRPACFFVPSAASLSFAALDVLCFFFLGLPLDWTRCFVFSTSSREGTVKALPLRSGACCGSVGPERRVDKAVRIASCTLPSAVAAVSSMMA